MSQRPTDQARIEQIHRDVAAFIEEMRAPAPNTTKAALIPFFIGAGSALVTLVIVVLLARLL